MKVWALICLFLFSSCSSHTYQQDLEKGNCEKALQNIPLVRSSETFTSKGKSLVGHLGSYTVSGTGYLVDVVIGVGAVGLTALVVCSPALLLNAPCKIGQFEGNLFGEGPISSYGKKAYRKTASWRCPDFQPLSRYIRGVSRCFSKRGKKKDLEAAKNQLTILRKNREIYDCLDKKEQLAITNQLMWVRKRLSSKGG